MQKHNENQPEFYYGIGGDIVNGGVFERFPELIPAVGYPHYWREDRAHKKMLLVGESNYFNDNDAPFSDFRDAEKWYNADEAKLIPENRKTDVSNWKSGRPFDRPFKIMDKVLTEAGIGHEKYLLNEAALYNYFLRPADKKKGLSFKNVIQDIDKEVSGIALSGIIGKLNPEIVIFLSEFASGEFAKFCERNKLSYNSIIIEHVAHPSRQCWTKDEGSCGYAKFEELLKKYWINK